MSILKMGVNQIHQDAEGRSAPDVTKEVYQVVTEDMEMNGLHCKEKGKPMI